MDEYKICRYCSNGVNMPVTGKTICRRKGVVPQEYSCKKFDFDPFKMCVNRIHNVDFTRFEKEDYSIE